MAFGFKLSPSSAISLDSVDLSVWKKVLENAPDALTCMSCGSCGASCTAAGFSGMSLRKVMTDLQRGREKEAADMLRCCMLCGKCTMVCPRGINTRRVILEICRNLDV